VHPQAQHRRPRHHRNATVGDVLYPRRYPKGYTTSRAPGVQDNVCALGVEKSGGRPTASEHQPRRDEHDPEQLHRTRVAGEVRNHPKVFPQHGKLCPRRVTPSNSHPSIRTQPQAGPNGSIVFGKMRRTRPEHDGKGNTKPTSAQLSSLKKRTRRSGFPLRGWGPAPGRVPTRMASRARASEVPPLTREQRSQRVKLTAPLTFPQWVRKTTS